MALVAVGAANSNKKQYHPTPGSRWLFALLLILLIEHTVVVFWSREIPITPTSAISPISIRKDLSTSDEAANRRNSHGSGEDLSRISDHTSTLSRSLPSLDVLTEDAPAELDSSRRSNKAECLEQGMVWIDNIVANHPNPVKWKPSSFHLITAHEKISELQSTWAVHQTAKSRCATQRFAEAIDRWRGVILQRKVENREETWPITSYYLHDDLAIQRLLRHPATVQDFPMLAQIDACLLSGTARSDLWRYVVLWYYGGIYADLDTAPAKQSWGDFVDAGSNSARSTNISQHRQFDALFVVEQYHMLSQYWMAVSPRHPLLWYAIHHAITNLLQVGDTGGFSAAMVTGPHALHAAFRSFCKDAGILIEPATIGTKPVRAGTFVGSFNRSVTVIGIAAQQNEFIERDVMGKDKIEAYRKMGMTHFQQDKRHLSGRTCLSSILHKRLDGLS